MLHLSKGACWLYISSMFAGYTTIHTAWSSKIKQQQGGRCFSNLF